MARPTMTEFYPETPHDTERRIELQDQLAAIDRDPDKLRGLIEETYIGHPNNPQILYTAATHLTALTYLDRRDTSLEPMLPTREDARRAFTIYTRLMAMLYAEREVPLYRDDDRIR